MNRIRDFDETELLVKLQQGDHKAFESIYDVHQSRITAHLMRLLKSEELAQRKLFRTLSWHYGSIATG